MRILRNIGGGGAASLLLLGALAATPAIAQAPKSFAPRMFSDQQTTYTRFTVNFNSCPLAVGALSCSVKVGAIPYNTFLLRGYFQTLAGWTGATTMTVSIGTGNIASGNSANIVSAQNILGAGNAAALTIVATALGVGNNGAIGVTGMNAPQTGSNGGFELWATLTATVAPPTAGSTVLILEYVLPNDGACTAVQLGAIAPGC